MHLMIKLERVCTVFPSVIRKPAAQPTGDCGACILGHTKTHINSFTRRLLNIKTDGLCDFEA